MTLMNLYWGAGAIFITCVAWLTIAERGVITDNWRILVAVAASPGIPIILARFFVPESPRYNMVIGQMDKASNVLKAISRINNRPIPRGKLIFHLQHKKPNFVQTFLGLFSREIILTTLLLWVIWFCLSYGSWGFSFIIPIVFDKLNGTRQKGYVYRDTLIVVMVGLIGYFFIVLVINRISRRWLMGFTFILAGISTCLVAVYQNATYVFIMAIFVNFFFNCTLEYYLYIYT